MATVIAKLRTGYLTKEQMHQIYVRVTVKKIKKPYDTGYQCPVGNWDVNKQQVFGKFNNKDIINGVISRMKSDAEDYLLKCKINKEPFSFSRLDKIMDASKLGIEQKPDLSATSFTAWMTKEKQDYLAKGMMEHAITYEKIISNLDKWKDDVQFSDLKVDGALPKLHSHLREVCKQGSNTIRSRFATMRQAYERAMANGAPYPNPFKGYKVKAEKKKKEKLTFEELELFKNTKYSRTNRSVARDMFMFSYFCRGIRFENVILIKKSDIINKRVNFQMVKSKKPGYQDVHNELQVIIDKYMATEGEYLFPIMNNIKVANLKSREFLNIKRTKGSRVNESLESIMKQLGINKDITFHCARHTLAYHMLKENYPLAVIQKVLGHSKISTTENYLMELEDTIVDQHTNNFYSTLRVVA